MGEATGPTTGKSSCSGLAIRTGGMEKLLGFLGWGQTYGSGLRVLTAMCD